MKYNNIFAKTLYFSFITLTLFFAKGNLFAKTTSLPMTPPAIFLDTESSTNIPYRTPNGIDFKFKTELNFNGSLSNNVEIAFGKDDVLPNGVLSDKEIFFKFGYDVGRAFIMFPYEQKFFSTEVKPSDLNLSLRCRADKDGNVLSFALFNENEPIITTSEIKAVNLSEIDMLKVTTRGINPHEKAIIKTNKEGLLWELR